MARSPWPEAASSAEHAAACLALFVVVTVAAAYLMPVSFSCPPPGASDRFVEGESLELPERSLRVSRRQDCAPRAAFRAGHQPPRSPRVANVAVEGEGDQLGELCVDWRRDERSGD